VKDGATSAQAADDGDLVLLNVGDIDLCPGILVTAYNNRGGVAPKAKYRVGKMGEQVLFGG